MNQRKSVLARTTLLRGFFTATLVAASLLQQPAVLVRADDTQPAAKTETWKSEDAVFQEFAGQLPLNIEIPLIIRRRSAASVP